MRGKERRGGRRRKTRKISEKDVRQMDKERRMRRAGRLGRR